MDDDVRSLQSNGFTYASNTVLRSQFRDAGLGPTSAVEVESFGVHVDGQVATELFTGLSHMKGA